MKKLVTGSSRKLKDCPFAGGWIMFHCPKHCTLPLHTPYSLAGSCGYGHSREQLLYPSVP